MQDPGLPEVPVSAEEAGQGDEGECREDRDDFQFKLKHAQEFLQEGSKVKASIFFRGRSIMFAEQGEKQLLRFAVELEEFGRAENMPVLEGKRMSMMIAPLKKK